jgi:hypothetical protein
MEGYAEGAIKYQKKRTKNMGRVDGGRGKAREVVEGVGQVNLDK